MTNFEKKGFSIGPGAFATPQETQATVLQELYRLNTTVAGAVGVHSSESNAVETAAARAFAKKILQSGVMGGARQCVVRFAIDARYKKIDSYTRSLVTRA